MGRSGERGSGISVLAARHDDDDDDDDDDDFYKDVAFCQNGESKMLSNKVRSKLFIICPIEKGCNYFSMGLRDPFPSLGGGLYT